MSSFTKLPPLEAIPPDYKLYRVPVDFEYHVGSKDSDIVVFVKKGTITDGASIPKWAWSIIGGPLGKYAPAAVVHDELYKKGYYYIGTLKTVITRGRADWVFIDAMKVLVIFWLKARTMWFAVRVGGWRPWSKYRRKDNADNKENKETPKAN